MNKLITLSLSLILLTACNTTPENKATELYKVSGEVIGHKCGSTYGTIMLNNGGSYHGKNSNCHIQKGTKLVITHDDKFQIREILIEGTEKIESK